jgi:putative endonuclease
MTASKTIWWVYMIRTVDDRLYSGVSTDVARRFREHQAGGVRAAKYLKTHRPSALVFSLPVGSRSLAHKVEYHMKRLPRGRKDAIIRCQRLVFDPQSGRIIT